MQWELSARCTDPQPAISLSNLFRWVLLCPLLVLIDIEPVVTHLIYCTAGNILMSHKLSYGTLQVVILISALSMVRVIFFVWFHQYKVTPTNICELVCSVWCKLVSGFLWNDTVVNIAWYSSFATKIFSLRWSLFYFEELALAAGVLVIGCQSGFTDGRLSTGVSSCTFEGLNGLAGSNSWLYQQLKQLWQHKWNLKYGICLQKQSAWRKVDSPLSSIKEVSFYHVR